ncbi:MAG: choice-of-anchor J domain-containing protein [Bacteroidota bacterium]
MRCILFFLLSIPIVGIIAQERCAVHHDIKDARTLRFEYWLKSKITDRAARRQADDQLLTIPVVFHIIHNGEPIGIGGNLDDQRILDQLQTLNEDFSRTNPDAASTPPAFQSVAASPDIQFALALRDPEGLPTTGITRTRGSLSSYRLTNDADLKSEVYWPAEDYLNIYVAELQGFLGWASFPFSNLAGIDEVEADRLVEGVVIDFQFIGDNPETGGSFESFGRTLTHEVGHYLGLKHVWGDGGCSVDDFCEDTPLSSQNYQDECPSTDQSSCDSGDMYSNFLNYTDDFCMNLFTACQRERMRAVLTSSPRRTSLLESPALTAPISVARDIGARRILAPALGECSSSINPLLEVRNYGTETANSFEAQLFIDNELVETVNFSSTTAPLAIQVINFSSITIDPAFAHDFKFVIGDVDGTQDLNNTNDSLTVALAPTASDPAPFTEDFEDSSQAYFRTTSTEDGLWTVGTAPSDLGNNQAAIAQFYEESSGFGEQHTYVLPNVDLTGVNSAELSFRYAYSDDAPEKKDGIVLAMSRDCGASFDTEDFLFQRFGDELRTTSEMTSGAFVPVDASDWETLTFNITPLLDIADLRFAIIAYNGSGNNIYLDDINLRPTALNALDLGIVDIDRLPAVTCSIEVDPRVRIRNYGFESVNSYAVGYEANGITDAVSVVTDLVPGGEESTPLNVSNLVSGENSVTLLVASPNGSDDQNDEDNRVIRKVVVDTASKTLPIREGFAGQHRWVTTNPRGSTIWDLATPDGNVAFKADGSSSGDDGQDHWLVSPVLSTANLQNGTLVFRMAYGEEETSSDRLRVMVSVSCGDRFEETLVDYTGRALITAPIGGNFEPTDDSLWREVTVDISRYMSFSDIRLAFVYTNSSGNNLYIDDVEIFPTSADQLLRFEAQMRIYPNPSTSGFFNVTLNLPRKDDVTIRLLDLSGKTIAFLREREALNQTFNIEAPGLNGVYLLSVKGENTNLVQRVATGR